MKIRESLIVGALAIAAGTTQATEARIYVMEKCPVALKAEVSKETGALAGALVTKLAGALVGGAIDSLASALSEEKSATFVGHSRNLGWYSKAGSETFQTAPANVCVIGLVADGFDEFDDAGTATRMNDEEASVADDEANKRSFRALNSQAKVLRTSFGLDRPPRFYFEARFVMPEGGGVFALEPLFLYYPRPIGSNVFLGSSKRDVLIKIEFSEPGEANAFASQELLFNGVVPGSLTTKRVEKLKLPWMKVPTTPTDATEAVGRAVPFNIKFLFTETAKPGRLGKIMGGVLKEEKATITAAIEEKVKIAVLATERQAARAAANETANKALTDYFAAYDAYKVATDAVTAAAGKPEELKRAESKQQLTLAVLKNAQSIAASAMAAAGVPFTPM